jgi:hypothetical protein
LTKGIRTSCKWKNSLYILSRNRNYPIIKAYIERCTILRKIIRNAKQTHYNHLLVSAGYKSKTTWNIIDSESENANNSNHTHREFKLGNKNIHLGLAAEAFKKYFLNLVEELNMEYANIDFAISFPRNWFADGFPEMKTNPITDFEITSTIAYLKSKNSSGYDGI